MNPSSSEAFGTPLTPSAAEQTPITAAPAEAGRKPAERAPAIAETAPNPASPGLAAPPIIPLPAPLSSPAAPALPVSALAKDNATALPTTAIPVTDDDLIEKEWVNKAKAIVERTRYDPHRQSEELTMVKADYMQKHYNKTIKLSK